MSKVLNTSPKSSDYQISQTNEFYDTASSSTCPSPDYFPLIADIGIQKSEDLLELGFPDRKKINGIPNFDLPLTLAIAIAKPT